MHFSSLCRKQRGLKYINNGPVTPGVTLLSTIMPPKRRGQTSASSKRVDPPHTPTQHAPQLPPHESPITKKVAGAVPYTSMHYKRDTRMNDLGLEMMGKFAGPLNPKDFLQLFLPLKSKVLKQLPRRMKAQFRRVAEQTVETAMYGPMVCPRLPSRCVYLSECSTRSRR